MPTDVDAEVIEHRFTYHAPQGDQPERYSRLTGAFKVIAMLICDVVPPGRERSLALTKLQESRMWANCGIAMEPRIASGRFNPPAPES